MAKVRTLDQAAWNEWVSTRPAIIQDLCRRLPPDRLYRLKESGSRVTIYSYAEDGTVTVEVRGEYNALTFERQVFGIKPEDLEECELPAPDEPVGVLLTVPEDIDQFLEFKRNEQSAENN